MSKLRILVLAALALPGLGHAQARPDCSLRPQTLSAMRGCYRPLLVFAPSGADARLQAQREALDAGADDMIDRFVLLVPVVAPGTKRGQRFNPPLDAPYALLPDPELAAMRRHYGVSEGRFRVLLLGEDGSVKLHSDTPVTIDRLNRLIDTMPTRQQERQRPHSN